MFTTIDGRTFLVRDANEFVQRLQKSSWSPTPDMPTFMRELAHRAKLFNGAHLRTSSVEVFVFDMIAAGLVRVETIN